MLTRACVRLAGDYLLQAMCSRTASMSSEVPRLTLSNPGAQATGALA